MTEEFTVQGWVQRVQDIAMAGGWSDKATATAALLACLDGTPAGDWKALSRLELVDLTTWSKIKVAIVKRFAVSKLPAEEIVELQAMRQEKGERTRDFLTKCKLKYLPMLDELEIEDTALSPDTDGSTDAALRKVKEGVAKLHLKKFFIKGLRADIMKAITDHGAVTMEQMLDSGVMSAPGWNLPMDELLELIEELEAEGFAFADDLSLLIGGDHLGRLIPKMNIALKIVADWAKRHGLELATDKCVSIIFTRKNKFVYPNIAPQINGVTINYVKETKYLGLILDSRLNWTKHLSYIKQKAKNYFYLIKSSLNPTTL